jgi:putative peptidoglycan lipid II flippase
MLKTKLTLYYNKLFNGLRKDFVTYSSGLVVLKGIGFAKEMFLAAHFGLSQNLEEYLYFLTLVTFPVAVIINPFQTVLIKNISKSEDQITRTQYALALFLVISFMSVLLALWVFGLKSIGIHSRYVWFLYLYSILHSVNLVQHGIAQAKKSYFISAVLPITFTLFVFIFIGILRLEIIGMYYALIGGAILEMIMLYYFISINISNKSSLVTASRFLKKNAFDSFVLIPMSLLQSCFPFVEAILLKSIGLVALVTYNYAFKIPSTIATFLISALSVVLLPHFSRTDLDFQKLAFYKKKIRLLFLCVLAFSIGMSCSSEKFIKILFLLSNIGIAEIGPIASIQAVMFLHMPFLLLETISTRLLLSQGRFLLYSKSSLVFYSLQMIAYFVYLDSFSGIYLAWTYLIFYILKSIFYYVIAFHHKDNY